MIPSVVVVPERGAQISRILLITFHDQKYEESSVCVCELSDWQKSIESFLSGGNNFQKFSSWQNCDTPKLPQLRINKNESHYIDNHSTAASKYVLSLGLIICISNIFF